MMLRYLLSSRSIQAGLACFTLLVAGSLLYSWHAQRNTVIELKTHDRFLPGLEKNNETRTEQTVNVLTENETPDVIETPKESTEIENDESLLKLENELRQLSLKELIPHFEKMETPKLRKFVERNLEPWLGSLIEKEFWYLSSEEQIALEIMERRADPEYAKKYEEARGYPPPPPGYTYSSKDGGPRELIKLNTPRVTIKLKKKSEPSYGQWELLSDTEWEQFQLFNTIVENNKTVWDEWNIQVPTEVVELAEEQKKTLYEKSYGHGVYHTYSISSHYTRQKTAEDEALKEKLIADAVVECERLNAERAQGRMEFFSDNREAVIALIRELKEDLQQR